MKKLYEPKSGILTVKYLPDENNITENPPRFCWLPANEPNKNYVLEISKDKSFKSDIIKFENIKNNFFAPNIVLDVGVYFWRYTISNNEYTYSKIRKFTITENLPHTAIPSDSDRFSALNFSHPRLFLNNTQLDNFKAELKKNPSYCNFDIFLEHAVKKHVNKLMIKEPLPYPSNKRVIKLWRQNFTDCQAAYNRIRFLSIAGVITENEDYINQSINDLIEVAKWDINGTTGRDYNDESSFRIASAIAWGFDWLYNYLTDSQKQTIYGTLYERTKQIAHHALVASKIHYSLYDSHAVRSLSSVLVPCCIALLNHCEEAEDWLNYTINYFNVLYTPWGSVEGGWSEGGMYWTTGMAYLLEAMDLLKNYMNIDITKRPFFQNTGDFPLYCFSHDTYRNSFGDQSNLGEKPNLKTAFNIRQYAGITGKSEYQWYFEEVAKREQYNDTSFFNIGWWDFYFDEMVYMHNYKPIKSIPPKSGRNVKWFKDIGWVALHSNMHDEKEHIALLTKSSPYGSVSHSHGDQNAITLFAYGEPLLIESGYYIGFNSSMHRQWRKKTKSKNTLLINNQGQYDQMDKTKQLTCTGEIVDVIETANCVTVIENATKAYSSNLLTLKSYIREIHFVDNSYFVIVDYVTTHEKCNVSYLLHSLYKPTYNDNVYKISGNNASLNCEFVYVSSGIKNVSLTDEFLDVDEEELIGLDNHWHFSLTTEKATSHVIVSCLLPKKNQTYNAIETIKDDQGHDVYLYFTNNGKTFSLCIDGNKRY